MLAEIIPDAKSYKSLTFSYSVPEDLRDQIKIGSITTISFGKKKIRGVVKSLGSTKSKLNYELKKIDNVDKCYALPASYLPVIEWISSYYFCTPGEALSLFLPPTMKRPPQRKTTTQPEHKIVRQLNKEQEEIYSSIIKSHINKPHLIYGVTGSGKTEIYLHLCRDAIASGKSVIVLVPEIILTPQSLERFREVFGDNVAYIHSGLSKGEKLTAYHDFHSGEKKILIGPRSALLIPNGSLGMIIIDEEHEDAYKQDNSPRYHAIDLAGKIASATGATLVLGSATPRLESYYRAEQGEYILHEIKARYNKLLLPPAEIVDLRKEIRSGNNNLISIKLQEAIKKILAARKQAILFLNRRGLSTFVSCRECGEVIKCPNCDIPLVQHVANSAYLYCHHCDFKRDVPATCQSCGGVKIKFFGAGVEKVENEVIKLFPNAKVRRIDAETIKSKSDYEHFYKDFKNRKFDIAVGTQMIAKGFDLPHVDLVGIVSADTGLHLPYFRANEKIFRLITQVSGRSGRASDPGQTIIQTYWPESKAILAAAKHDFKSFYLEDLKSREIHNYPPFCSLIRVISEHEKPETSRRKLEDLAVLLDKMGAEYIGPGQCFLGRIRGRFRNHIIIKLHNSGQKIIKEQLHKLWRDNLDLIWDIDPVDLL